MIFVFLKAAVLIEVLLLIAISLFRASLRPQWRTTVTAGDVAMLVAIPIVGLFGMDKNVFYGFLFILPLLWVGQPERLAPRYVLGLTMFPELGELYTVHGLYLGVLSAVIFYNAGALLALALTRLRRLPSVRSIDAAVWLLFFVDLLLASRGVPLGGTARAVVVIVLLIIPPYYLLVRMVGTEEQTGDIVSALVFAATCNGIIAIYESLRHWAIYETMTTALGVQGPRLSANLSMRAGMMRASGAVSNYEVLGLIMAMALPAVIAVRNRFSRPAFYVLVSVLAAGLVASQARSAWIACIIGLLLQATYDRRWGYVGTVTGLIVMVGTPLAALTSSEGWLGQLLGKGGHGAITVDYRQRLLERGWQEAERHPWTGYTLPQLNQVLSDLKQGDHIVDFVNVHLHVMLIGGAGMLAVWVFMWSVPIWQGWRVRRSGRVRAGVSAGLPFALLGMMIVYLTFTSAIDRVLSLVAFSMGLMSICVAMARRRRAVEVAAPKPTLSRPRSGVASPALVRARRGRW